MNRPERASAAARDRAVEHARAGPASSVPGPTLRRMTRLLRKRSAAVTAPLDFQILGRVLLHAALVGAAAGLVGSLFVALLEVVQRFLLEGLTGYLPLKAAGELVVDGANDLPPFRPWLLWSSPALGALVGGAVSRLAPETRAAAAPTRSSTRSTTRRGSCGGGCRR